ELYQVRGIPSTFFIDKDGTIRAIFVGGADAATIESNIQKVLNPAVSQVEPATATSVKEESLPSTPVSTIILDNFPTVPPVSEPPPRIPLADFKALYDDPAN